LTVHGQHLSQASIHRRDYKRLKVAGMTPLLSHSPFPNLLCRSFPSLRGREELFSVPSFGKRNMTLMIPPPSSRSSRQKSESSERSLTPPDSFPLFFKAHPANSGKGNRERSRPSRARYDPVLLTPGHFRGRGVALGRC